MDDKTEGQRLVDRKEMLDAQLCISEHVTRQAHAACCIARRRRSC